MTSSKPCATVCPLVVRPANLQADVQNNKQVLNRHNDVAANTTSCGDVTTPNLIVHSTISSDVSSDVVKAMSCTTDCRKTTRAAASCDHVTAEWTLGDVYRHVAVSSFYHGRMSSAEASVRLRATSLGTFLLRDSSDRRYMFALSVQTSTGPTSIRIGQTRQGLFRLDCDVTQRPHMPVFRSVIELVGYYKSQRSSSSNNCYLVDKSQARNSKIMLVSGLDVSKRPATLLHLARLAVHATRSPPLALPQQPLPSNGNHGSAASEQRRQECLECFVRSLSLNDDRLYDYLRQYPFSV